MTTLDQGERKTSFELLKKYGMRWAVLTALALALDKQGLPLPAEVNDELRTTRMRILSGCFSPCEVGCALGKVEGHLVAVGAALGEDYLRPWFTLLGQAMQGLLDPSRIADIPALDPVASDCRFLACRCGPHMPPARA
jgi:hypothetical protein